MNDSPDIAEWRSQLLEKRAGTTGLNYYRCTLCGKRIVTIDVDPGVTPMYIGCRATPDCDGTAQSGMYPQGPPPRWALITLKWEWRIPTDHDLADASPVALDHAARGGLTLKPWTGRPSAYEPDFPPAEQREHARQQNGPTQ